jgi:hypothetical protein
VETSYLVPVLVALSVIGFWLAFFVYAAREDLDNVYNQRDKALTDNAAYPESSKIIARCVREHAERHAAQKKEWRKRSSAAEKAGNGVAATYWSRRESGGEGAFPERLVFRSLLIKQVPYEKPRYFPATAIKTPGGGYRAVKHPSYMRVKGERVL